jgi:hypothetical protein
METLMIKQWGIVMYRPGDAEPKEDYAAFDGWYAVKAMAEGVFKDWCKLHPDCIVSLVEQCAIRVI